MSLLSGLVSNTYLFLQGTIRSDPGAEPSDETEDSSPEATLTFFHLRSQESTREEDSSLEEMNLLCI